MKKIVRKISILAMAIFMFVFVLAASGCGETDWYEIMNQRGLTVQVTFDANGGAFQHTSEYTWHVRMRPGSTVPQLERPALGGGTLPSDGQINIVRRVGHLAHPTWHRAYYYEDQFLYDEQNQRIYHGGFAARRTRRDAYGDIMLQSEPWDFSNRVGEEGDTEPYHLILYANWTPAFMFRFMLITDDCVIEEDGGAIEPANAIMPLDASESSDEDEEELYDEGDRIGTFIDIMTNAEGRLLVRHSTIPLLRSRLPLYRGQMFANDPHSLRGIYTTRNDAIIGRDQTAREVLDNPYQPRVTTEFLEELTHNAFLEENMIPAPIEPGDTPDPDADTPEETVEVEYVPNPELRIQRFYTTWIQGTYRFFSDASQIGLGTASFNANIYLEYDIDFYGWRNVPNVFSPPFDDWNITHNFAGRTMFAQAAAYNGSIRGNGFTIRNIYLEHPWHMLGSNTDYGLFRNFGGIVRDVTFENVTLTVFPQAQVPAQNADLNTGDRRVGFFAGNISAVAIVQNVTFAGDNYLIVNEPALPSPNYSLVNFRTLNLMIGNGPAAATWQPPTFNGVETISFASIPQRNPFV